jgi:hypothetical protein
MGDWTGSGGRIEPGQRPTRVNGVSALKPLCCKDSGPRQIDGVASRKYPRRAHGRWMDDDRGQLALLAADATDTKAPSARTPGARGRQTGTFRRASVSTRPSKRRGEIRTRAATSASQGHKCAETFAPQGRRAPLGPTRDVPHLSARFALFWRRGGKWEDAAHEWIFGVRAYQQAARRVYQPATLP